MSLYFLTLGQPVLEEGASTDEFGAALASNADIDGDGLPELVISAPGASTLYVYTTTGSGLDTTAAQTLDGEASTDRLGAALVLQDLDGDGYADLVAGAPARSSDAGAVYVYKGTSALLDDSPARADGAAAGDALGTSLAVGDLDGSGVADILAGAPYTDGSGTDGGAALVFLDGATTATTTWTGTYDDDQFGAAVAVVPDIDGDGDDEAAVGAPGNSDRGGNAGAAFLFTAHDAGAADWTTSGGENGDELGLALVGGDFTGDGYGDLVVGSRGEMFDSALQLFASSRGTLGTLTAESFDGPFDSLWLGPAGDIDSDGDDDLFAAYSETDSTCGDTSEAVAVVGGDPSGFGGSVGINATGAQTVVALGDIYGSGLPSLAAGGDDGVFLHAGESDADGVSPDMPVGWGDCDDRDDTRNPLALERDGDGIDSDCDGNDDILARAVEACPDLDGDLDALLEWVANAESGRQLDNQAVLLEVLEEARSLPCLRLVPTDASSVADASSVLADCDDPGIDGFSANRIETRSRFDEATLDCFEVSSRARTLAITFARDIADTAEPAAIDGWVREASSEGVVSTEAGGWVLWQDGTLEPVRAASYEHQYDDSYDGSSYAEYDAVLPLAGCDVTVATARQDHGDVKYDVVTVTSGLDWLVYEESLSWTIACGKPGAWEEGVRVSRPEGATWLDPITREPYPDADADGWPVDLGDCDDTNPLIYPCAEEDGIDDIDNDCNGSLDLDADGDGILEQSDCDDHDANVGGTEDRYTDLDGDGWGGATAEACPGDEGLADTGGDCDDTDPNTYPGATEVCDGIDNDCGGNVDDYAIDAVTIYADGDNDGYGGTTERSGCPEKEGYSMLTGDCDDQDASINPGAEELTANAVDENCDGVASLCEPGGPCDHSDTRGCLGSFALTLGPLALGLRRRRGYASARRRPCA